MTYQIFILGMLLFSIICIIIYSRFIDNMNNNIYGVDEKNLRLLSGICIYDGQLVPCKNPTPRIL